MKTALIINPQAGQGRCLRRWNALQADLRAVMGPMKFCPTETPGHATTITRQLLHEGYEHVISAGGDGTHFEVVNGWLEDGTPISRNARLTPLPMGTGSDLARSLGIKPGAAGIAALRDATTIQADIGCIDCNSSPEGSPHRIYFLNMARIGLGASACRYVNEHTKSPGGFLSYLRAILVSLAVYRDHKITFTTDNRILADVITKDFSIAKGSFDAGGMRMAPHARLDNGIFDCYHIGPVSFLDALRSLPKLYAGRLSERRDIVTYLRSSQIEATSPDPVEIEADGEFIGFLPAKISLLPGALRLTAAPPFDQ